MTLKLRSRAVYAVAALMVLVGCASYARTAYTPSNAFADAPQVDPPTGSWMLPEARAADLLYVTNYSYVSVLTYPEGRQVGVLKGFVSAVGACTDASGNIFITNFKPVALYEYAHGGTKRIAVLREHSGYIGCAVDPVTKDIAVTGSSDSVSIFEVGKKNPLVIKDPAMFFNDYCTYDDKGNLYIGGNSNPSGGLRLAELPRGTRKFTGISIGPTIDPTQSIQWSGSDLAAVSFKGKPEHKKISIAQLMINGSQSTQVSATPLNQAYIILQYFITHGTIVVPNWKHNDGQRDVLFYNYPKGGVPVMTISKNMTDPRGTVVSYGSGT